MSQIKDISLIKDSIATLVADRRNDKERLDRIVPYLEEGYRHRTEVITRLSVMEGNLKDVKENIGTYQEDCTHDRDGLDRRIDAVEMASARQAGKNSVLAAVISMAMVIIGWFVDRSAK